jgi:hypothetical protein
MNMTLEIRPETEMPVPQDARIRHNDAFYEHLVTLQPGMVGRVFVGKSDVDTHRAVAAAKRASRHRGDAPPVVACKRGEYVYFRVEAGEPTPVAT